MSDLLYMLVAVPICAALAAISTCRLNNLDPQYSKLSWMARYFILGCVAAGVGLEAMLHPAIFATDLDKIFARIIGLSVCAVSLYFVLQTRYKWSGRHAGHIVDNAPPESNRAPLGEL